MSKFKIGQVLMVTKDFADVNDETDCGQIVIYREPSETYPGFSRCFCNEQNILEGSSLAIQDSLLELLDDDDYLAEPASEEE